jgi:hypothetical protein
MNNYLELIQATVENKDEQAYQRLFNMGEPSEVASIIIQTCVKYQYLAGLSLVFRSVFHRNLTENIISLQNEIATNINEQKQYDFIIPCILNSHTTMFCMTEALIKSENCELFDYMKKNNMGFDYQALKLYATELFEKSSSLMLLEKLSPYFELHQASFDIAVENTLHHHNWTGIEYLLNHETQRMKNKLSSYADYLNHKKDKSMYDKKNFLAFVNLENDLTHGFLIQFLELLQKDYKLELNDFTNSYVVGMFMTYQHIEDSDKLYQFLEDLYALQHSDIPEDIAKMVSLDPGYQDFQSYYEKKKLEKEIQNSFKLSNKIKL